MYICSLDAVKCFDNIWHAGLFYKLLSILNKSHWRFLCNWYRSLQGIVRVNGTYGTIFDITKGTRQGSILSPCLFNIFIDDLLQDLNKSPHGMKINGNLFNNSAYADDINLFAISVADLQSLIDICYTYSKQWRFEFGLPKSNCLVVAGKYSINNPNLTLGHKRISCMTKIEVRGKSYNEKGSAMDHVAHRIQKSRRAMYAIGYNDEGLLPAVKAHLWKSVGLPSLLYAVGSCSLKNEDIRLLESFQGTMVKSSVYLNKRARHSALLKALNIQKISHVIDVQRVNLLRRLFNVRSQYTSLCLELISQYTSTGTIPKNTLVGNILDMGLSPLHVIFTGATKIHEPPVGEDGIVDSIHCVLRGDCGHLRRGNQAHRTLIRLTKSF